MDEVAEYLPILGDHYTKQEGSARDVAAHTEILGSRPRLEFCLLSKSPSSSSLDSKLRSYSSGQAAVGSFISKAGACQMSNSCINVTQLHSSDQNTKHGFAIKRPISGDYIRRSRDFTHYRSCEASRSRYDVGHPALYERLVMLFAMELTEPQAQTQRPIQGAGLMILMASRTRHLRHQALATLAMIVRRMMTVVLVG